ncbi:MAG TPA: hypothetical protein VMW77_00285 [Methanoregula sp.]|nr:hypothetical protein [Methanoregula sp.]
MNQFSPSGTIIRDIVPVFSVIPCTGHSGKLKKNLWNSHPVVSSCPPFIKIKDQRAKSSVKK